MFCANIRNTLADKIYESVITDQACGHEVKSSCLASQITDEQRFKDCIVAIVKWGDCYGYGGADHRQGRGWRESAGMQVTVPTATPEIRKPQASSWSTQKITT